MADTHPDALARWIGKYVRIESPSRYACGRSRDMDPCSPQCCDREVIFGGEYLVTEVIERGDLMYLMGDEGMAQLIDNDTTIEEVDRAGLCKGHAGFDQSNGQQVDDDGGRDAPIRLAGEQHPSG